MPHIHEKIDFTVAVFIVYQNKVFLRMHDKYRKWLPVGGHVELDEDPSEAATREAKEESGLDVVLAPNLISHHSSDGEYKELIAPRAMNRHSVSPTHVHVDMVYFAKADSDEIKPEGDDISNEWCWLTKEELLENKLGISENVRNYALAALDELSS